MIDKDDRKALATLAIYVVLAFALLVLGSLTAGLCIHLFRIVAGV